ncbi:hypothetical protein BDV95DRAFT_597999 [Massariosphaeria phaeospora]|uniref:Uncharacterized protein n=1 Tax=Massariosphaeria phaeospora TaxID=100035 RepID=A0A7C8M4G7_9PLEO|nr:hypothetical protein BDV95DRAFT_597999 [Massariosphaeria phaeospora]
MASLYPSLPAVSPLFVDSTPLDNARRGSRSIKTPSRSGSGPFNNLNPRQFQREHPPAPYIAPFNRPTGGSTEPLPLPHRSTPTPLSKTERFWLQDINEVPLTRAEHAFLLLHERDFLPFRSRQRQQPIASRIEHLKDIDVIGRGGAGSAFWAEYEDVCPLSEVEYFWMLRILVKMGSESARRRVSSVSSGRSVGERERERSRWRSRTPLSPTLSLGDRIRKAHAPSEGRSQRSRSRVSSSRASGVVVKEKKRGWVTPVVSLVVAWLVYNNATDLQKWWASLDV